jgi:hypothetical protein
MARLLARGALPGAGLALLSFSGLLSGLGTSLAAFLPLRLYLGGILCLAFICTHAQRNGQGKLRCLRMTPCVVLAHGAAKQAAQV